MSWQNLPIECGWYSVREKYTFPDGVIWHELDVCNVAKLVEDGEPDFLSLWFTKDRACYVLPEHAHLLKSKEFKKLIFS